LGRTKFYRSWPRGPQGFCYNFTSTGQLSDIRQFLSDNLSSVILCYQTDKFKGGGVWKIRPQILHSECLCQCSNLFKKCSFFYQVKQKSCKFKKKGITTFLETFSQPFLEVRQTQSHFHFPVLYQKHQHVTLFTLKPMSASVFCPPKSFLFFCLRRWPLTFKYNLFPSISVLANTR
jgi:hypothetical protein